MNAKLEIYFSNTSVITDLNNVLVEEYPDGTMVHADNGFVLNIPAVDVASTETTDDVQSFWMKNDTKIILSFVC